MAMQCFRFFVRLCKVAMGVADVVMAALAVVEFVG